MRALIIDQAAKDEIARVKEYASHNRFPRAMMVAMSRGRGIVPGDHPDYTCSLQMGFKVVYTIEEHPSGWGHHISISVDAGPDTSPNPAAVNMILKEFGFAVEDITKPHERCRIYMEGNAVNVIELY